MVAVGCVDVDFASTTGSTSSSSSGGGGAGTSTTTGSTASSGGGTSGTGGAGGSGGGGPCVPTTETCNGADDDCDGIVDEPAGSAVGPACGCTWSTYAGKLYALCPTTTGVAQSCPGGTDLVVLEDAAEQTFVTGLFTSVHGTTTYGFAYVSLVQSPSSNDRVGGWAWVGGEGMPIPWGNGQPDDYHVAEPAMIENHDDDCGAIAATATGLVLFADAPCGASTASAYVACEQTGTTCTSGSACLVAEGCTGTFDCTKPEGQRCVAQPKADTCNGLDDDCDGQVDGANGNACSCTTHTAASGLVYRRCAQDEALSNVHCGPGFKLATPDLASEVAFVQSLIQGAPGSYIGAFQSVPAAGASESWTWLDRSAIPLFYWGTNEPNDGGLPESDKHNCMRAASDGWHDGECTQSLSYICEALP